MRLKMFEVPAPSSRIPMCGPLRLAKARYSPFVLKVPLNPNQSINRHHAIWREPI